MANKYFKANINCGEVSSVDDINNCLENFKLQTSNNLFRDCLQLFC